MQPEAGKLSFYERLGGLHNVATCIDTRPAGCQYPDGLRRTLNEFGIPVADHAERRAIARSTRRGRVVDSAHAIEKESRMMRLLTARLLHRPDRRPARRWRKTRPAGRNRARRGPAAPPARADPRSEHARLCHGEGIAGRRRPLGEGRRKLHPRSDAQSRAGDDRAGRRAAGNGLQLHDGIDRQQDLSRHRARARTPSARPDPADPAKLVVTTSHPLPTRARWRSMSPSNTSPARPRRSSSARMDPTGRCSRRSTT